MGWKVIQDPPGEPRFNMERDEELAQQVRSGRAAATLRIYGWTRPAISLGHRQSLDDLPAGLLTGEISVVRRPTGGGAVLHRTDEITYALALPQPTPGTRYAVPPRDLPSAFHHSLRHLLIREAGLSSEELTIAGPGFRGPFSLCFDAPVCGDLLYRGKKVAGSALRVWKDGLLVQGSLQRLPVQSDLLARAVSLAIKAVYP